MKHSLKIKEEESFLHPCQGGHKRRFRYSVAGSKEALQQFKKDILSKKNLNGSIYKEDGSLSFYSFTGLPSQRGVIIRLSSGKWLIDTAQWDRMSSVPLHPDIASSAGKEYARMLLHATGTPDDDEDIDDDIDEDEDDFTEDEFTSSDDEGQSGD
jgi:hypothetical protein